MKETFYLRNGAIRIKRVFETILEKLEGDSFLTTNDDGETNELSIQVVSLEDSIKIVHEVEDVYKKDHSEIIKELLSGEWVDTNKVQETLGINFNECFPLFDFSRTSEWWSVVGETEEERAREGQKVITKFRLKSVPEHTYENCHNITCRRKCEKVGHKKAIDDCIKILDTKEPKYHDVLNDRYDIIEYLRELKVEDNK